MAKWEIGSQYSKVDLRVVTGIVFIWKTRKKYLKVYQGKSNTLTRVGVNIGSVTGTDAVAFKTAIYKGKAINEFILMYWNEDNCDL